MIDEHNHSVLYVYVQEHSSRPLKKRGAKVQWVSCFKIHTCISAVGEMKSTLNALYSAQYIIGERCLMVVQVHEDDKSSSPSLALALTLTLTHALTLVIALTVTICFSTDVRRVIAHHHVIIPTSYVCVQASFIFLILNPILE